MYIIYIGSIYTKIIDSKIWKGWFNLS